MKVWVLLCLLLGSVALAQPPLDQARLYTVQSTIANGQGMASIRLDPQNTLPGTARNYSAPLSGGSLSHPVSLFPGDNKILVEYGSFSKEVSAKLQVKAPEVRVELRWAGKNQDYDLYVKNVNYQNTDAGGGKLDQDWISEDLGHSDPGVENITFAEAEAGLYPISVNYYRDNEDDNDDGHPDGSPRATTVNVFVDGMSVYTATRTISKYDQGASFWPVGTLVIHSGEETGGYMVNPSTGLRDMLPQKAFLDKFAPRGDFKIDEISGPNGTDDVYLLVDQSAQFELTGTVNVGTENEEGNLKIIGDFEVSDTTLAIVDEAGVVSGIAPGTVEVRSISDKSKKVIVHLVSVSIAVVFGEGPGGFTPEGGITSKQNLESYLETVKVVKMGDVWVVEGMNNRHFGIEIGTDEVVLLRSLRTSEHTVIFDGHANFGFGPNFSKATNKTIDSFTNFGAGATDIPITYRGDGTMQEVLPYYPASPPTNIPVAELEMILDALEHMKDEGWSYLVPAVSDIKGTVTNDPVPNMIGRWRYESTHGVSAGNSLVKQGSGIGEYHFISTEDQSHSKRVIVSAPGNEVPPLHYKTFFYNACSSGPHFIEKFSHGEFIYTNRTCAVFEATPLFVKGLIEGKTTTEILGILETKNADGPQNQNKTTYEVKDF